MQATPALQLSDLRDDEKKNLYAAIMEHIPAAGANPFDPSGITMTAILKGCRERITYQLWPSRVFQEALNELKKLHLVDSCKADRIVNGSTKQMTVWHRGASNIGNVADTLPGIGNIYMHEPEVGSH